jgi:HAD superfamily hydrolase (TIGR01490 family)
MKRSAVAAFFDFDQTLIEVESGHMGIRMLRERGMLPLGYFLKVWSANILYQWQWLSEAGMARILLTYYRRRRLSDFEATAEDFYLAYLKPHLAPRILDRLEEHRRTGHLLVLISGSVRYMLEPVVRDLGLDRLFCTELEEDADGLLTGRSRGAICVDRAKQDCANHYAQEAGVDLKASFAYGNHPADIPLLETVGHPHVVEPTRALARIAARRSWPVLSFR